jgi:predicted dehydrogenase
MTIRSVTRRSFLQSTAIAATASPFIFSKTANAASANERISLGFIGVGMMGRGHLGRFLNFGDVQVNAICEIEQTRRENAIQSVERKYADRKKAGTFKGVQAYTDFRELLARDDIDAVVIATPDHWHALQCLAAAKAKKDIYCEKPLTHSIKEGRMIVDAVKKNDIVFQTGSQQRSEFAQRFRNSVEFIWAGRIGKIKTVRIGVGAPPIPCDLPKQDEPGNVDWNMWQGPAPERAYNEVLCPKGNHRHFPLFRSYREYAGGGLADMGAHHFDIAQWALGMDNSGPVKIEPPKDGANSGLRFVYANGVEMFHGGKSGCTFEGTEGTIYVNRPVLEGTPKNVIAALPKDAKRVYPSTDHRRNWVDCIRSRKETICPPEVGHRTASVCHLANLGYQLQRPLQWDPKKEEFVNDAEANKLRFREPRGPWKYDIG